MNDSKISVRYARALFQSAVDSNLLEPVAVDIRELLGLLQTSQEFKKTLSSPIVKPKNKFKLLVFLFGNKFNRLTISFLDLLLTNKRENFLEIILLNFLSIYKQRLGYKTARITTAVELDNETNEQIARVIKNFFDSNVEIDVTIKPSIIGGFVLRIDDKQIDTSVAGTIAKLRRELQKT